MALHFRLPFHSGNSPLSLQAVGPTASLIFAVWIVMSVLQQRYITSCERYRSLISEERCPKMRLATSVGVASAITLITGLVCAALGTMLQGVSLFKYLTALFAVAGLSSAVWAATIVIAESSKVRRAMDSEISEAPADSLPDLRT